MAEERNTEYLNLKTEAWLLQKQLEIKDEQFKTVSSMPRLAELRERVLQKLKVGRQSAVGKGIDLFIKHLEQTNDRTD
ncbi:hypothetical protein G7B40_041070 [Aetokthonos hydrillicola Thurmond2011]|uniref:Uncharacterized protein n=1 Tax=Aetokthonos hydrillicola Thurmond2011 TaxID=2712845 RepID=A0AAP5IHB9_9CYAN|nr:hypothetical protein [Aetokthonos hydrillicola]MBO3463019.1 hypothetical protein [Aetokthonos hydrillicola CCALA 1050]MBW4590836.1 hypothetical protein [Aetokthonos hydrillicola CCALA 1050]MDR9900879.1 hypothetical protein [Aetokthonos hydrillicola Thurmond2011]